MKALLLFLIVITAHSQLLPPETYIDNASYHQQKLSHWKFTRDRESVGIDEAWFNFENEKFQEWDNVVIPHNWNIRKEDNEIQQGDVWYQHTLKIDELLKDKDYILQFNGVFKNAEIWVNGKSLSTVNLPYLSFQILLNNSIKVGSNNILVKINNEIDRKTLPATTTFHGKSMGWYPYGGISRDVIFKIQDKNLPRTVFIDARTNGFIDIRFNKQSKKKSQLKLEIFSPTGDSLYVDSLFYQDTLRLKLKIKAPKIWSPEDNKNIYRLKVSNDKEWRDYEFGFRDFQAKDQKFFLNGKRFYIKGMNRHDDHPKFGATYNQASMQLDIKHMKELGTNFTRPGHYPIDTNAVKLLENSGIIMVEEVPAYQLDSFNFHRPEFRKHTQDYVRRMVTYHYNRPGIVMWSMVNEIFNWISGASKFVKGIKDALREIDPYRPTMVAVLSFPKTLYRVIPKDRSTKHAEVIGLNLYHGWYFADPMDSHYVIDKYAKWYPEKTMFISEYGAGSIPNLRPQHEDILNKENKYTEEFQNEFLYRMTSSYMNRPRLQGVMPWVLNDFKFQWKLGTDPRQPEGMNVKGLFNYQREKKPAFDYIKALYQQEIKH